SFKPDFTYYLSPKSTVTFGAQAMLYDFFPGKAIATTQGVGIEISQPNKYALESAIYIGNDHKISDRFSMQYGLRYSFFNYMGKGTAYSFNDTIAGVRKEVGSTTEYDQCETIANYINPEPRFSFKYNLTSSSSVKGSYNRTAQYIHLLSN